MSSDDVASDALSDGQTEYVIYIDQNAPDGGNGSLEHPFNDLYTGFNNVSKLGTKDNIVNITINIFGGNYTPSMMSTNGFSNYIIRAMPNSTVNIGDSSVIFMITSNAKVDVCYKIYGINFNCNLMQSAGNVEFNDCIISKPNKALQILTANQNSLYPRIATFNNCIFNGMSQISADGAYLQGVPPYKMRLNFTDCQFINVSYINLKAANTVITRSCFNNVSKIDVVESNGADFSFDMSYSTFINNNNTLISINKGENSTYSLEHNWWGSNNILDNINFTQSTPEIVLPSTYAVFDTSVNYFGDKNWEILGKLNWNDGTDEGIENFAPMAVSLSSTTGSLSDESPVLKDGSFKVGYVADSLNNEIEAVLDNEVQTLSFNNVDVGISVEDIYYGSFATVTLTIPSNVNGTVTVTVNNKDYVVQSSAAVIDVTVDEILDIGSYDVFVSFSDKENNLYGMNSTTFNVNKLQVGTKLNIIGISEGFNISGVLEDVEGNALSDAVIFYTINGGDRLNATTDANGTFAISISDNSAVQVYFEGNDDYLASNTTFALKNIEHIVKDVSIEVENANYVAVDTGAGEKGKLYYFTLKDGDGNNLTNKTVNVVFNGKVYTVTTNADGKANITIAAAAAKTYDLNVFFMGDDDYKGASAVAKIKVTKKVTSIKPAKTTFTFKANAKSKIVQATLKTSNKYLKAGKKVTITIKGKTYTAKTLSKGLIKINIKALNVKGKYNAKIRFAGDSTYKACYSSFIKIVIK